MRREMAEAVSDLIEQHEDTCLFLADIGVHLFRRVIKKYPQRAMNIGIFEDGMISVAAGLSIGGMEPVVYGIAPFLLERALEQLKLDFAYQNLGGNFIAAGAAYDFSFLGYSHYCPEDFAILKNIPGVEFIAPGCGQEFQSLFKECSMNHHPTYYRMSDYPNRHCFDVTFGKANVIKKGTKAVVIAVGTILDTVLDAVRDEDVTLLYYTTLAPFDTQTLAKNCISGRILICEPEFSGSLDSLILPAFENRALRIAHAGLPVSIYRNYGTKKEKDRYYGLTVQNIRAKLNQLIESGE